MNHLYSQEILATYQQTVSIHLIAIDPEYSLDLFAGKYT